MGGRTVWLFGHQLSLQMPALKTMDRQKDRVLIVRAASRAGWLPYHKQKIAFVYAAMAHFAAELRDAGYIVDERVAETFSEGWAAHAAAFEPDGVDVHVPTDARFRMLVLRWAQDQRPGFVVLHEEAALFMEPESVWEELLPDGQSWKLDGIYRKLRQKHNVLMDGSKPAGGKWSYDSENRKPPKSGLTFSPPPQFEPDPLTRSVMDEVARRFADCPGALEGFAWPVTRTQAEALLDHFISERLPTFGDYQDAMITGNPWMSHSLISAAVNVGLLHPADVVQKAEMAYRKAGAPLSAVEGFIRQILGWREYVRGVYLRSMPGYAQVNALGHDRPLPALYWGAPTKMNCLQQTVGEVLANGYSHHIQRLMVLGNFANLAGVKPQEVADWFNQMYVDAYDWVVLPNVLGMALYADGGVMSTKPYVSSGQYIHKMSDYCKGCSYDVGERTGPAACPFHSLYWDFIARHRDRWRANPRMGTIVSAWDKMDETVKSQLRAQAADVLGRLDAGTL